MRTRLQKNYHTEELTEILSSLGWRIIQVRIRNQLFIQSTYTIELSKPRYIYLTLKGKMLTREKKNILGIIINQKFYRHFFSPVWKKMRVKLSIQHHFLPIIISYFILLYSSLKNLYNLTAITGFSLYYFPSQNLCYSAGIFH